METSVTMSEKFCLKWNDFQSTVSQSFYSLRQEKEFFDVTVVSEDELQLSAHKLVLSACSSFFKNIFKKNVHASPLIYLSGISSSNLKNVLDYIYCGEVQLFQDQLESFFEVAKKLKISGLLAFDEDLDTKEQENRKPQNSSNMTDEVMDNEQFESQSVSSNSSYESFPTLNTKVQRISNPTEDIIFAGSGTDERVNEILIKEAGIFKCQACGKTGNHSSAMKRHAETHLEGLSYSCPACDKTFRSSNSLNTHISKFHRPVNY